MTVAFTEQTPALIAPAGTITDTEANLESMTVTLTARPDGDGVESLSLNGAATSAAAGLSVNYTAATGVLSISGTATVATYQTILQGILYDNTSDNPTTSDRSVTVLVNDGDVNSTSRTSTINVTAVNDAPTATITPTSYAATEQTSLNLHGTGMSVADPDAGSADVSVTLSVGEGTLTVAEGTTGVTVGGNGSASVTLTGTIVEINDLLAGNLGGTITYLNGLDIPGASTTLTLEIDDLGNTGGGSLTDSDTATINITAINDIPEIVAPTNVSVDEDDILVFTTPNTVQVADPDIGAGTLNVTLISTHGKMTMTTLAGLTFTTGDGTDDTTMAFSGSLAAVNAALLTLTYDSDPDYFGAAQIDITTNDNGNSPAPAEGDSHTININVLPVNDGPSVTVPGAQAVDEDSIDNPIAGVSVADPDSGANPVEVTITSVNGSFSITVLGGLTFSVGDGTGDATMTFQGTVANVNLALASLLYTPNGSFNGADSISVSIDDLGNTGGGALTDSDSFTINVANVNNDAPVITVPGAQVVDEDDSLDISGISVADSDDFGGTMEVSLSVTGGTITLGSVAGLTFIGGTANGEDVLEFTGTKAAINAALATLSYEGNLDFNGPDVLTITVDDLGNTGAGGPLSDTKTVNITVNAVNDAPAINSPASVSATEDVVFAFTGGDAISITDVDVHEGTGIVEVTLAISSDTISLGTIAGLTFTVGDGTLDSTMTFTGLLADVNAALASLIYTPDPNFNGSATLSINVSDLGNFPGTPLTDSATVTVNVAPVNDAPVLGGGTSNFDDIDEDEPNATNTGTLVSTLLGAALTDVDAGAVQGIAITSTSGDGGNGTWEYSVDSGSSWTAFPAIPSGSALLLASDALTFIRFVPNANYNTASGPLPSITYRGWDQTQGTAEDLFVVGTPGGTSAFSTATATSTIEVEAVNDAPVIAGPTAVSTNEDTTFAFTSGDLISISDVDVGEGTGIVQVILASTNGTMTMTTLGGLTFSVGDGTGDAAMTFTGLLADVNVALATLSFTPALNYNGTGASVVVNANDQGNFPGAPLSATTLTIAITVDSINDAPAGTDNTVTTDEDIQFNFTAADFGFTDTDDVPANSFFAVTITTLPTNGTLFLGVTPVTAGQSIAFADIPNLNFVPDANEHGTPYATFTFQVQDDGGTANGGIDLDQSPNTLTINVNSVNDAPAGTDVTLTTNEDTQLNFTVGNFGFSDTNDSPPNNFLEVTIVTLPTNGTLRLGLTPVTAGQVIAFADITSLNFVPDANEHGIGYASFTFQVRDDGGTSNGGIDTDPTPNTITIDVTAVNDAPAIVAPGTALTNEDTPVAISGISIIDTDVNEGTGEVQVTLSATHGTMTISTTGLTFTIGDGTTDSTMTFSGLLADVNAALGSLVFIPDLNYNGLAQITIDANDMGNFPGPAALSAPTKTIDVTINAINDAPVLGAGTANFTDIAEDDVASPGTLVSALLGTGVSDPDGPAAGLAITVRNNSNGSWQYTLNGVDWFAIPSIAAGSAFVIGSDADNAIRFVPNADYNGSSSVTFRAWDQSDAATEGTVVVLPGVLGGASAYSSATATSTITITAVNDPPVATITPASYSATEHVTLNLKNTMTVSDPDSGSTNVTVTLTVGEGTLTVTAGTSGVFSVTGSGTSSVTIVGTEAQIRDLLTTNGTSTVTYVNNLDNPSASTVLTLTIDDGGATGGGSLTASDTATINITAVNDAPVVTAPATAATDEDTPVAITGVNVTDVDIGSGQYQITLTAVNGTMTITPSGVVFSTGDGTADTVMVFTGTQAQVTAALASLSFTPDLNYNGAGASVTILANDQGNTGGGALTDSKTINITVNAVNDAPTITSPATATTDEDVNFAFTGGNLISVADVDVGAGNMNLTLTVTNGVLNMTGGTGTGTATVTFTGTLAALNAALATLVYVPNSNFHGSDTLSITVDDDGNTGAGGVLTANASVAITVNNVDNDAPVITVPGAQTVDEDDSVSISGISVADPDIMAGLFHITLKVDDGTITLGTTTGVIFEGGFGNGSDEVRFTVNAANVNAVLGSVSYAGDPDFNGSDTLTITVSDQGNTGSGGPQSDTETIAITVNAVNDAPTVTGPATATTDEDAGVAISGFTVADVDVDEGAGQIEISLTSTNGTMTLSVIGGLTFSVGDGTADSAMTFTGTLVQVNAALNSMTFNPAPNFHGDAEVVVTANDLGNFPGTPLSSAPHTVDITVEGVNDVPSFTSGPNIEFTVEQDTNTPTFADVWPGTQNVTAWATDLSAGLGETIVSVGPSNVDSQFLTFEVEVLTNAGLFLGTPTITVDGSLSTATLHFTPAPQQFGTAILRARVNDNFPDAISGERSAWKIFTITIAPQQNSPQPKVKYLPAKTDIGAPTVSSTAPAVATNMVTGDFVAVWSDAGNTTISFQMYSADGTPGTGGTVNTSAGNNAKPAVAMGIDGSFVVAWEHNSDDILAQRFDAAGAPDGGEFTVNDITAGQQANAAVSMNIDGSFQIAFSGPDADGNGVYVRRYDDLAVAIGLGIPVNTVTAGTQSNPSIASDALGNFVVAWQGPDATGSGVFARRYDAGSDSFDSEFDVNTDTNGNDVAPGVGMDALGNFVVGWANFNGTDSRIRFQQFGSAGAPFGAEITVATVPGFLSSSSTTMDADGDFVMVWNSPTGIQGARYRVTGTPDDNYAVTTVVGPDSVQLPRIASDGDGDFIAVWQRTTGGAGKIDLQQYSYNEAPYDLDFDAPASIDETADSVPATITAGTEAFDNNPDDTFTYTLDDDAGGRFSIDPGTGVVSIVNPANIDFESAPDNGVAKGYTITVRATDSNGLFRTETKFIEVNDLNETPVLTVTPVGQPVAEHSPVGTVVGTASAADPDAVDDGDTFPGNPAFSNIVYSLTSNPGGIFAIDPNTGVITVADADALEFNDAIVDGLDRYFLVTVRAEDHGGVGGLSDVEDFRIYVTEVTDTTITNIRVGDDAPGRSQRSRVDQLEVTFSEAINLGLSNVAAAFTLTRLDNNTPVAVTVTWNATFTVATLKFSGSNTFAGSVIDGNYSLVIDGSELRNNAGIQVDADGDNAAGGTLDFRFYRFFGDFVTTGEYTNPSSTLSWRLVDPQDALTFAASFGFLVGHPNYDVAFDFDNDGDVDPLDVGQFVLRFNTPGGLPEIP